MSDQKFCLHVAVSYYFWDTNQPDNVNGDQDCLYMVWWHMVGFCMPAPLEYLCEAGQNNYFMLSLVLRVCLHW